MTDPSLAAAYAAVRQRTDSLAAPLSAEDAQVQSMPDASPAKWHLAHTSWFFETFVLSRFAADYRPFRAGFEVLFNSYYEAVGPRHTRAARGLLTRPTLDEVKTYRAHVDRAMAPLLDEPRAHAVIELGLAHEEQHQELLLTDIQHAFFCNPLRPAYRDAPPSARERAPLEWAAYAGGVVEIGHPSNGGFAFDNEGPRHRVFLESFAIASRLVTNAEYAEFVEDGGYARADLWLSDGWALVNAESWRAPLYWQKTQGAWHEHSLAGTRALDPHAPAVSVSFYEADAFARWKGARLPTEAEWEHAFSGAGAGAGARDAFAEAWQWTASPYVPYPRFRPLAGALGEYNGKFMCNQMVLRGSSAFTPPRHARLTYRNFFPPSARWQRSGIRLARDA